MTGKEAAEDKPDNQTEEDLWSTLKQGVHKIFQSDGHTLTDDQIDLLLNDAIGSETEAGINDLPPAEQQANNQPDCPELSGTIFADDVPSPTAPAAPEAMARYEHWRERLASTAPVASAAARADR